MGKASLKSPNDTAHKIFSGSLVFIAVALISFLIPRSTWPPNIISHLAVLIIIALVAESLVVEFSDSVFISSSNFPILLSIIFLGPLPAGIVAAAAGIWNSRKKEMGRLISNVCIIVIPSIFAALLFNWLKSLFDISLKNPEISKLLFVGAVCGICWELMNFGLISIGVRLKFGQPIALLWRRNFVHALPTQLLVLGLGLAIAAVYAQAGIVATVLFFIPIFASQYVYKLLVQQKSLLAEQTKLSQDLMDMNIGLAGALIMLLDSKDHYTASHSAGVAMYCRDMARMMGMSEDEQRIAHMAGLLHDLGKVGTPDSVLKKKGELTAQEWEQIKQHPTTAAEVLSQLATHKEIADIIRHHQEHYDGSGYPYGISGEDIPELSRMLAVADTYHALTSNRPYREAKSPFEALIILRRVAGTQLDPKYVEVMAQVLKNEDLSYREGSKADFLSEFRKGRPALSLDKLRANAEDA